MSIIKRGNSKYWYIQFQYNGRTYIKSSRTGVKRLAEQMEADMRSRLHAEQFLGQRQRLTVRKALEQFCESKKGTPYYRCLKSHQRVIARLVAVNKNLADLTSQDLERFRRDRLAQGVGAQTIKHGIDLIRGAWKFARKLGYQVGAIEFPQIKIPRTQLRYLTDDEEPRLLHELDPCREANGLPRLGDRSQRIQGALQDAYDLVVLLLDTGARYSEIANIKWSAIDLTARTINLWRPKVQNEAVLYMTDRVFAVLSRRAMGKLAPYVFVNRSGGPRGYAAQSIRKAFRRAGLSDCRIHTLRHTHASRLIQNGMTVYEVREVLGHTDIKTTMRYAHLETRQVTSKARDVVNRLNLNGRRSY